MHKINNLDINEFIYKKGDSKILADGSFTWKAPSNIALVKYWGKHGEQLPKNTSISFTLDACHTITTLEFVENKSIPETSVTSNRISNDDDSEPFEQIITQRFSKTDIFLDGKRKPEFQKKIGTFLMRIMKLVPFLTDYDLVIKTHNSFPHSSGIASSASGMAALALCIMNMEKALNPSISDELFYKKASLLARLGSGSAARSIKGSLVVWGEHPKIRNSSDYFGVEFPHNVHENFKNFHDIILLVDKGEKQVSSTVGHNLMHEHPFAEQRFKQANDNIKKISTILQNGDLNSFIEIVESEALTLHAMMMTSNPYFILMKPNTLSIINKIWEYRKETGLHICFTLDAGANVHILFPEKEKEPINKFITTELLQFCQNNHYICDRVGKGAKQM